MAVSASDLNILLNTFIGDSSTDRISAAERLAFHTEATFWLLEELGNEHMVDSYDLSFVNGVHQYKITSAVADLLVGADLRQPEEDHYMSFTRKSSRELAEELGNAQITRSWAIDRYDGDSYLMVSHKTPNPSFQIATFDTLTADGGGSTWTVDAATSDATNATADSIEFKQGSGCLNYDLDVSQDGTNRGTVYNDYTTTLDLSQHEDLSSFIFRVYIPDVTYTTSYTLTWSSDASGTPGGLTNYWSASVTTAANGTAFVNGWNRIKVDWPDATMTGTPDASVIQYLQIDVNYGASQGDDTDYRIDDMYITKPETLKFHYVSAYLGVDTNGTDINAFTATTDVPFFSGVYDSYKHVVAHKAASLAFYSLRLRDEALVEETEAFRALNRYRKNFESGKTREEKSFKVAGVNLANTRARFNRR